jgi:hypothetical protein
MRFLSLRSLLCVALVGAALFYFTDNPFNPIFLLGLGLASVGAISAGALLSYRLARGRGLWKKSVGYAASGVLFLVVFGAAVIVPNYRAFFYHRLRPEEWQDDLKYLVDRITQIHPNPFSIHSREEFEGIVKDLHQRIPALSDPEIEMEFAKVVALAGDGHTDLIPFQPATGFNMYPLQLYYFSDGLFVTEAAPGYRDLIGCRVAKIGDLPIEKVHDILRKYIGADNEWTVKDREPLYYVCREILQSQGIVAPNEDARFTFANAHGQVRSLVLRPTSLLRYFYWYFKPLRKWKYSPKALTSLSRQNPTQNYWFTYLSSSQTLFFKFNQIREDGSESFDKFTKRLFGFAQSHPVHVFVIDLRDNSGGDNTIPRGFVKELSANPSLNRRGRLFTLIGRHTFSAAVNFTTMLENETNTIFVGEPTGAGPNHYGDPKLILLPHSKLIVFVATRRWQFGAADDTRREHSPSISVGLTHDDYFSGRDPAFDAALAAAEH